MSRTKKGSKPPGWEPWSNRHERQQPLIEKEDTDVHNPPRNPNGKRARIPNVLPVEDQPG